MSACLASWYLYRGQRASGALPSACTTSGLFLSQPAASPLAGRNPSPLPQGPSRFIPSLDHRHQQHTSRPSIPNQKKRGKRKEASAEGHHRARRPLTRGRLPWRPTSPSRVMHRPPAHLTAVGRPAGPIGERQRPRRLTPSHSTGAIADRAMPCGPLAGVLGSAPNGLPRTPRPSPAGLSPRSIQFPSPPVASRSRAILGPVEPPDAPMAAAPVNKLLQQLGSGPMSFFRGNLFHGVSWGAHGSRLVASQTLCFVVMDSVAPIVKRLKCSIAVGDVHELAVCLCVAVGNGIIRIPLFGAPGHQQL